MTKASEYSGGIANLAAGEFRLKAAVRRLGVNFGWLLSSQILIRLIGFGFGTFLVRYFGPRDYGQYVFVLAYVTYFGYLADAGLGRFLIREVARDQPGLGDYLPGIVGLRIVLAFAAYLALLAIALLIQTPASRTVWIGIAGLSLFSGAFSGAFTSVFDGRQEMRITSLYTVIATAANAILILAALALGFGLAGAFAAHALSNLPALGFLWIAFRRRGGWPAPTADLRFWRRALQQSLPYALLGVIGLIFFRTDTLMLTWLKGANATGIFVAADRLVEALAILPGIGVAAAFPLLSRLHSGPRPPLRRAYFGALGFLAAAALPASIATWALAGFLIHLLYGSGAYADSVLILRILSIAVFLLFLDTANTMLLYSGEDLRLVVILSVVTMATNIGLNLVLIPRYSYTGAAVSTVVSEAISLAIFTPTVLRYLYA
ncbi:MAG: flippase [Dehalococcoidia bacterium]